MEANVLIIVLPPKRKMNSINDRKLLEAQNHVWKHTFNFITSMSLKCAMELNIPDVIHSYGQPMTLSQLVFALPINPKKIDCVFRLMRLLLHSGFFTEQKICSTTSDNSQELGYILTAPSYLLLKDNPISVGPFSLMILDSDLLKPWQNMSKWFQNDDLTPCFTAHSKMLWELAGDVPRVNKLFNEALASDCHFVASLIIRKHKSVFEGLKSYVDVGGGTGTMAKAIAEEFSDMECIVLDLPHVIASLNDNNNLKYVGGDMFETIPNANAILLKHILHDWSDEECVQILKNCKEVIMNFENNGGKVIIIDIVMGFQNGHEEIEGSFEVQLLMDMEMMALLTGKERNEKEWAKLFSNAGFHHYKISSVLGPKSIIEVYP